ncbi:NTP transferase domain-containing protein [Candidatus Pacearchaeota archaeon]|nr:hypothetical protein [uncultured archaeon]AQS28801.1 hypothetical protein [uncultured archaeon]MBS3076680.1 NTP transferase domain-containing protein [Candidatus Pacearchaeota archaeon]
MKCVILCGGKGTRMGYDGENMPKTLLKIGEKPVIEHIMDHYAKHGLNKFILCLGYGGEKIRFHFFRNPSKYQIEMVDTGEDTNKAQRLSKIKHLIDDVFLVSYGDDLADINISKLLKFHREQGKIATLSAIRVQNPYGILETDDFEPNMISDFKEKPIMQHWVNGGYFVFDKNIFEYIQEGDDLEKEVFHKLIKNKNIVAYRHPGFWKSMNTLKDVIELNEMSAKGELEKIFGELHNG